MKRVKLSYVFVFLMWGLLGSATAAKQPNFIFILADDMGYGDVACYNPETKIPTPHMDQLAAAGIRFTDAHTSAAFCTPSRYGLLTGRYCWRSRLKKSVLFNFEPPLIEPGRMTLASLLKQNGYRTALMGKWHLGLGFTAKLGRQVDFKKPLPWYHGPNPDRQISESIDFTKPVFGGPEVLGFHETFYTAGCSTDQQPFCFIANGKFMGMEGATYRNPSGSWRSGMAAPLWVNETVDIDFTTKALGFIEKQKNSKQPFFIYLPLSSPHSPHLVPKFSAGKSKAGVRGDMIWLVDHCVGRIVKALDKHRITDNTLLIVTSDNGPLIGSLKRGEREATAVISNGHKSAGNLRGYKGRPFEGGHRVPFIARWPGRIPKGVVNHDTFCLVDMLATTAALVGAPLPKGAGEDSQNLLPSFFGKPTKRGPMVNQAGNGVKALRDGPWKIIFGQGANRARNTSGKGMLFNLKSDPFETTNLWDRHPDRVEAMKKLLNRIQSSSISINCN
jgi:arylsulfatase A